MGLHERRYRLFIKRLRAARAAAGLSQAQAARKLRWTQSRVSRCETGARRIDAVELLDLCLAYGVRPETLIPEFARIR